MNQQLDVDQADHSKLMSLPHIASSIAFVLLFLVLLVAIAGN